MRTDVTLKAFSPRKENIQQLITVLEKEYVVTQSSEISWNENHEDFEVWIHLLSKDNVGKWQ